LADFPIVWRIGVLVRPVPAVLYAAFNGVCQDFVSVSFHGLIVEIVRVLEAPGGSLVDSGFLGASGSLSRIGFLTYHGSLSPVGFLFRFGSLFSFVFISKVG
jgi:hypothetical protein